MTDEQHPEQYSDDFEPVEPLPAPLAGGAPAPGGKVTSGLAERKNPVFLWLKESARWLLRAFIKDPLATLLLFASLAITFAFFTMLDSTEPSSPGTATTLSEVSRLSGDKQVTTATLLDGDARVVIVTKQGQELWAAYPASGATTQQLTNTLGKNGAIVSVDQQSGKETKRIIVQFLLPILLLLFSAVASAATPPQFRDPAEEARFRQLTGELRCVMCQNQSLADSNAQIAHDLRMEVLRLMREGRSDAQIK